LEANLVVHEVVAGKLGPLDRVLTFLDLLLGGPATVVEPHHAGSPADASGSASRGAGDASRGAGEAVSGGL